MGNINLLPEELREKEQKEIEAVSKKPKTIEIKLSTPSSESKLLEPVRPKPSLFSRLFFRKKISSKKPSVSAELPNANSSEQSDKIRPEKKFFEISHQPKPVKQPAAGEPSFSKNPAIDNSSNSPKCEIKHEISKEKPDDKISLGSEKIIEIKNSSAQPKSKRKRIRFNLFGWFKFSRKDKTPRLVKVVADKKEDLLVPKLDEIKTMKNKFGRKVIEHRPTEDLADGDMDVNLIPEELAELPADDLPKKIFASSAIIVTIIVLLVVAYCGIIFYQGKIISQAESLRAEIKSLDAKIAIYEKDKAASLRLQEKFRLITSLLNKHVYWTQFFAKLEKYTVSDVYYTNFSMAGTQKLVLAAVGADYESVARQILAFQQADDFIADVEVASASAEIDSDNNYIDVNFNINLTVVPEVFLNPIN